MNTTTDLARLSNDNLLLEVKRAAATERHARRIPAAVKREVWKRDGGRCAFVGSEGRCSETGFLEFHHVEPYAAGGAATTGNVQLRCRAHNAYEAELFFGTGERFMARERAAAYVSDGSSFRNDIAFAAVAYSSVRRACKLAGSANVSAEI